MARNSELAAQMVRICENFYFSRIPYKWGGKTIVGGLDCSGLACEVLQSVGILKDRTTLSSRGLHQLYEDQTVAKPAPGCLVFYGRKRISHVAIAIDETFMIEAGGGDSTTKSILDSIRKRASVRRRPINRRSDLVAICDPFAL